MLTTLLLLWQPIGLPDIELRANVRARSVTIEKQGEARLTVSTSPEGRNLVDVEAPSADGRKTLRDVEVNVRVEARIADAPQPKDNKAAQAETAAPK